MATVSALAFARALPAQNPDTELRVRLESTDATRLSGALVALLDSAGRVVTEGVGREDGTRVLRAPAGSYRVRVRRIGFLPFLSEPVSLPRASELALSVESPRVQLQTIVVTSRSSCGPIDPEERVLTVLCDEIAKALRTSQLSPKDLADFSRAFVYRRTLKTSGAVVSSDTVFHSIGNTKPFDVVDPATLARSGYVLGNERLGWRYFAPDEAVLLSDEFAATHCFKVVRDKGRPGQVGIEFEPIPRRSIPDIEGVLWVDESSAELRELTFRYVNAGPLERFRARGFARFRRVPSGSWIVDEWALVAPVLKKSVGAYSDLKVTGYVEDGGGMTLRPKP
ncbi:MAG TPA: carboxypeptidase-like regulatory domain-containing protein [Gemmatimonadaceae bacterium]|nr:carboxypeptidase-like regulatory domain-containing protein [Gemmatimonadaceae bacterium]